MPNPIKFIQKSCVIILIQKNDKKYMFLIRNLKRNIKFYRHQLFSKSHLNFVFNKKFRKRAGQVLSAKYNALKKMWLLLITIENYYAQPNEPATSINSFAHIRYGF